MWQGHYDHTFDMSLAASYNAPFLAANGNDPATAFAALLAGAIAGEAYLNIHSNAFPGGEIRGFLNETPLPAALPLFATGLGVLGLIGWRRKRKAQPPDQIWYVANNPRRKLGFLFSHVRYWHRATMVLPER